MWSEHMSSIALPSSLSWVWAAWSDSRGGREQRGRDSLRLGGLRDTLASVLSSHCGGGRSPCGEPPPEALVKAHVGRLRSIGQLAARHQPVSHEGEPPQRGSPDSRQAFTASSPGWHPGCNSERHRVRTAQPSHPQPLTHRSSKSCYRALLLTP